MTIRFVREFFADEYDPTIEDSYQKQVDVDGSVYQVDILDTAGQEEYSAMRDMYMAEGESFVICYSSTNADSFQAVMEFAELAARVQDKTYEEIPLVLVQTKCDMPQEDWEVTESEGRAMATRLGCPFVQTSAFTGQGVKDVFQNVVKEVLQARRRENEDDSSSAVNGKTKKQRRKVFKSCKML